MKFVSEIFKLIGNWVRDRIYVTLRSEICEFIR